jgi:hypothetical protein
MTQLLHSLSNYMTLIVKKYLKIYTVRNRIIKQLINKFKYILSIQGVIASHNRVH